MALTTKEAVKALLGGTVNAGDDPLLTSLASAAHEYVVMLLGYDPIKKAYVETYDGHNGVSLALLRGNLTNTAVTVSIDGKQIPQSYSTTTYGFVVDRVAGLIHLRNARFPRGHQNIEVTYEAGFDTYPADLSMAATEIAATKFRKRSNIGIQAKSLAQETITYMEGDVPSSAREVISRYVRRFQP